MVLTLSNQTGDTAHVAAAAALDDNTDILVLSYSSTPEALKPLMEYYLRAATGDAVTGEKVGRSCIHNFNVISKSSNSGSNPAQKLYSLLASVKREEARKDPSGNQKSKDIANILGGLDQKDQLPVDFTLSLLDYQLTFGF